MVDRGRVIEIRARSSARADVAVREATRRGRLTGGRALHPRRSELKSPTGRPRATHSGYSGHALRRQERHRHVARRTDLPWKGDQATPGVVDRPASAESLGRRPRTGWKLQQGRAAHSTPHLIPSSVVVDDSHHRPARADSRQQNQSTVPSAPVRAAPSGLPVVDEFESPCEFGRDGVSRETRMETYMSSRSLASVARHHRDGIRDAARDPPPCRVRPPCQVSARCPVRSR